MLKRIIKILLFVSVFILFIPSYNKYKLDKKIDDVIISKSNNITSLYEGYIYIPKFNYKNLIKKGDKALDENLVSMHKLSDPIGGSNIILSGHNNKYVFHKLYNLVVGDEIIISDFNIDKRYIVNEIKKVSIDDSYIFNIDGLKLITCTNNNQVRLVVICIEK
ncbi:MAG: sortase [Bacilli bacterium]|nr:sortase [Bacilli bacterium]